MVTHFSEIYIVFHVHILLHSEQDFRNLIKSDLGFM
jgi:hypothetical protein